MQRNCCHVSLAFVLKLFNFLQAFVGVSIILYSTWMLDQWNHHVPVTPSPFPAPSPDSDSATFSSSLLLFPHPRHQSRSLRVFDAVADFGYLLDNEIPFHLNSLELPTPWFIYSFMGVGIILCCISFIGCVAAESINGCCLCFYTILKTVLILIEAALVAFIALDHDWDKAIPSDPTGEFDSIRSFVEKNNDICKWVGIAIVTIQALALLLAMVLRAMVSPRRSDYECEDDYENARGRIRDPLLNQSSQVSGSASHSDIWSSRMREKYGLNSTQPTLLNQNASMSMKM